MKKVRLLLAASLAAIVMTAGCTIFEEGRLGTTATSLVHAKLADSLIQSGVVTDVVLSADYSEEEIQVYVDAIDLYNDFREQLKEPSIEMYVLLDTQYSELYTAYNTVADIVRLHWDEYPPFRQTQLRAFQGYAVSIDATANLAMEEKNQQVELNSAIELGLLIANIAAI